MKKFIIAFMVIVLSFSMVSCTKDEGITKEDNLKKEERQKEVKNSEDLVKRYLELNMQGKFNESIKMVDEVSTTKKIFNFDNNIKLLGYKIQGVEKLGSSMEVTVDVITCEKESPYYSINNIKYTVNKKSENDKILITNADENTGLAFFKEMVEGEPVFMIREGKKTSSKPVFTVKDIPSYISIKTNYLQEEKVKVGGSDIGAVAISGNGNQMIISSFEKGNTLYSASSKQIISKNIMEKFNSPEYTIKNAYFNNDNSLTLQVESIKEKN